MGSTAFSDIMDFIDNYDNFLVFGHEDPDADSICSQIVISLFLKSLGKTAQVYACLPFTRIELMPLEKYCKAEFSHDDLPADPAVKTAVFLLDCAKPARTGPFAEPAAMFPKAIIDHHRIEAPLTQGSDSRPANIIDSNAPSTTFIIYNFLKESGYKINSFESSLLFLGLSTDTGFFRHLTENSGDAFKTAGELCNLGASPNNAFYSIYGNRTIASRKFLGIMLSRAETYFNGQLLIIYEKLSDLDIYSLVDRDKDILYQILQGTKGVKIVASFTEEAKDRKCTVSLRTREDIDLNKMAAHFGGGGHKKASGYTVFTGIDEAISSFVSYTETFLL